MKTSNLLTCTAILAVYTIGATALAEDSAQETDYQRVGKAFVAAKFSADRDALTQLLAPEVVLLEGHEYLKKEYGVNPSGDRTQTATVKREKLIELDAKVYSTFPKEKLEKIRKLLAQSEYRFAISKQDGMTMDPRTRTLPTRKGDVVMVVLPEPGGDYLLYVMRKIDGAWKVVMDYTD